MEKGKLLGSVRDFAEEKGVSPQEVLKEYSEKLLKQRLARAAELGIDIDTLHKQSPLITKNKEATSL